MRIAVIGTGHVGLVTCASLASVGHEIVGCDSDAEKIQALEQGRAPFYEPGLEDLLKEGLAGGNLRFSLDVADAVAGAEAIFICVGTPPRASGEANLLAVEQAARGIARALTGRAVVVEKSTVPAGTSKRVHRAVMSERPDLQDEVFIASNPEFLREGKAVEDALDPDRILVGANAPAAFEIMRRVYEPFTERGAPLIETDIETAELAKHACNAFLAMKISYMNALARLCERSGADVVKVADVMGADARIGRQFLDAGLGYGGYCFPKDLQAFERLARSLHYDFPLLREIARINEEAVDAAFDKVTDAVWNIEGKTVTLLGLSFKPQTDDVRLSPALSLAKKLLEAGATVTGYDPEAAANAKAEVPDLDIAPDPYEAAAGAHCIVLCTDWEEFKDLDLERLRTAMAHPVIVDGRNLLDPQRMTEAGFTYLPMGRPSS